MTEREIFYRHLGLPSFTPLGLEIVKAEGIYLYDRSGNRYFDLISGICVTNTGHRHPYVVEAIRRQTDAYLHVNVYGEYIQSPQVKLARRLVELLPPDLDSVYFVNSGSEAVEGALKLAKRYNGRTEMVAFRGAYHGSSQGALSMTGSEDLKRSYRPLLPEVRFLDFNDFSQLEQITRKTGCVIVETIQAEAGLILPREGFLNHLRARCDETGALLIIDDVQMGMGRTGRFFSFEHFDLIPDILVLAKALGAGMPLGAFVAPRKIMDTLAYQPELGHITTFGGHPLSCAAALAGIEVLVEGDVIPSVEKKGGCFQDRLSGHSAISGIRRAGLAIGIDLADPSKRKKLTEVALQNRIILDWYLFKPATFRIAPPLTITEDEIEESCRRLLKALSTI